MLQVLPHRSYLLSTILTCSLLVGVYITGESLAGNAFESPPRARFDMMVRSTHRDIAFLLPMLMSARVFLDWTQIGEFFVIFDAEVPQDYHAAQLLPDWVTVRYEAHPNFTFPNVASVGLHEGSAAGWSRSQWSNFWSDQYGSSPYIGIFYSDVVLKAFCGESVSFFDAPNGRPRLFCTQHRDLGMTLPRHIEPDFVELYPWSCMESFPFVFKRAHFKELREWLTRRMATTSFNEAYGQLMAHPDYSVLAIGQYATMGAWAYTYRKDEYSWAIGGSGPLSTCPVPRVAHHVGYAHVGYSQIPKLSRQYFQEASRVVAEGLCYATCPAADNTSYTPLATTHKCPTSASKHQTSLLSLEGPNEMMFGDGPNLRHSQCAYSDIFVEYDYCLAQRCKDLAAQGDSANGLRGSRDTPSSNSKYWYTISY